MVLFSWRSVLFKPGWYIYIGSKVYETVPLSQISRHQPSLPGTHRKLFVVLKILTMTKYFPSYCNHDILIQTHKLDGIIFIKQIAELDQNQSKKLTWNCRLWNMCSYQYTSTLKINLPENKQKQISTVKILPDIYFSNLGLLLNLRRKREINRYLCLTVLNCRTERDW